MKKKKKNMKHEGMVLILWIFYRKRKSLANGCSHELKLIHIQIWIFPHEYPTKKTKFGKMEKIKNGKCENKNTLKVPKKPSVLDYKNIFIKASIPSITRFFVFFKTHVKGANTFFSHTPAVNFTFCYKWAPSTRARGYFLCIFNDFSPKFT